MVVDRQLPDAGRPVVNPFIARAVDRGRETTVIVENGAGRVLVVVIPGEGSVATRMCAASGLGQ